MSLNAVGETDPVESPGDAADDPAIWLHPDDPSLSLVIGTDKRSGLFVYDLEGKVLQHVASGSLNNVDLRYGFRLSDDRVIDLVAASNRDNNSIALYAVDPIKRRLYDIGGGDLKTDLLAIYGLCMASRPGHADYYVYANSQDGALSQYLLVARRDGRVGLRKVRTLKLATKVEGCVVDDRSGALFVGEEALGIWRFEAWPSAPDRGELVVSVGKGNLMADVEGLAILPNVSGGFLFASSQGNSTFAVYQLAPPHELVGSFRLSFGQDDAVTETDGIEILTSSLGVFRRGLLVVQDGYNTAPSANQNFKLVDLGDVVDALSLNANIAWDPRLL